MKVRKLIIGSLIVVGSLALPAQSQVLPLGKVAVSGGVSQASCDCGQCDSGPLWGGYGLGRMAGRSCGDPICGSTGLGYAGGFGSCDSCGVGGYFGRNIYRVEPCACGGSLVADLFSGVKRVMTSTMSGMAECMFGGLQTASCHASGSFAALKCAARCMTCSSCGAADCDGASCGAASCGVPTGNTGGYFSDDMGMESYESMPIQPVPATESVPAPPGKPATADPFTDDPDAPLPQASRLRRPATASYLYQDASAGIDVSRATYQQPVSNAASGNKIGTAVQGALRSVIKPSSISKRGYVPAKTANFRRK